MASGSIVGGGEDGAVREKQRYTESRVYTRKLFKGPKKAGVPKKVEGTDGLAQVDEVSFPSVEDNADVLMRGISSSATPSGEEATVSVPSGENNADAGPKDISLPNVASEEEAAVSVPSKENNMDVGLKESMLASEEKAAVLVPSRENNVDMRMMEDSLLTVASEEEAAVLVPSSNGNVDVGLKEVSLPTVTSEEEAVRSIPSDENNGDAGPKEASIPMVASEEERAVSVLCGDNNVDVVRPMEASVPTVVPTVSVSSVENNVDIRPMGVSLPTLASEEEAMVSVPSGEINVDIVRPMEVSLPMVASEEEAAVSVPSDENNVCVKPMEVSLPTVASEEEALVSVPSSENNVDVGPKEVSLATLASEEEAALTTQPPPSSPLPQPAPLSSLPLPPLTSVVVDVVSDETVAEQLYDSINVPSDPVVERLPVVSNVSDEAIAERLPVVNEVSDDTIVVEQEEPSVRRTQGPPSGNGALVNLSWDSKVKFNLLSQSKQEIQALRKKFERDLDMVRNLMKKIEEKEGLIVGYGNYRPWANDIADNGSRIVYSEVGSVGITPRVNPAYNQLSVSVFGNTPSLMDSMEKEKRTPKANQFYRNSEFLLAKDKFPPAESNKKSKTNGKKKGGEAKSDFGTGSKFSKSCSSLLERLMKHQYGWVFNTPVDVKGLGLHDYFTIIKHPMDLGTIKSRLSRNLYKSPLDFAEDVRLTFQNAMTYNPKGQDVHFMAEVLLKIFEDKWPAIESDYNREVLFGLDYEMGLPTPTSRKIPFLPQPLDLRRVFDRSDSMTVPTPKPVNVTPSGRTPAPKKPKAKDSHKRDMTYDEKQKLSTNLQNLPSDKLDNIVQIIKKRNSQLFQHDDEIEVDIDNVDTETLWELDRFVTNYKKSLSKNKRKAELAMQARAAAAQRNIQNTEPAVVVVDAPTRVNTGEKRVSSSLPAPVEAPTSNSRRPTSSNSSSSDSGSSSSDSDTDSSSASGCPNAPNYAKGDGVIVLRSDHAYLQFQLLSPDAYDMDEFCQLLSGG
ncbi:hypothetical protein MLD38_003108 [Melastoma candidum]|uniref:Uncharacterized protein n=1 Tax=Melastoma candidum TaxID=119954 RepID=A0ACB9S2W8_9MYRT|nr:hypothetical protein MLD38_003108 [Melastoma candidum]